MFGSFARCSSGRHPSGAAARQPHPAHHQGDIGGALAEHHHVVGGGAALIGVFVLAAFRVFVPAQQAIVAAVITHFLRPFVVAQFHFTGFGAVACDAFVIPTFVAFEVSVEFLRVNAPAVLVRIGQFDFAAFGSLDEFRPARAQVAVKRHVHVARRINALCLALRDDAPGPRQLRRFRARVVIGDNGQAVLAPQRFFRGALRKFHLFVLLRCQLVARRQVGDFLAEAVLPEVRPEHPHPRRALFVVLVEVGRALAEGFEGFADAPTASCFRRLFLRGGFEQRLRQVRYGLRLYRLLWQRLDTTEVGKRAFRWLASFPVVVIADGHHLIQFCHLLAHIWRLLQSFRHVPQFAAHAVSPSCPVMMPLMALRTSGGIILLLSCWAKMSSSCAIQSTLVVFGSPSSSRLSGVV